MIREVKCSNMVKTGWFFNRKTLRVDIGDYEYGKSGRVKAFKVVSYINNEVYDALKYTVPRFTRYINANDIKINLNKEISSEIKMNEKAPLVIIYSNGDLELY